MSTIADLVTDALTELGVARAGDAVGGDSMALALRLLNRLLDLWNANDRALYAQTFADYTLTAALSPHTIGPGGTFDVTTRPESVKAAAVNIGGSPAALVPIAVRTAEWYQQRGVPTLTTSMPTDVYYDRAWPVGNLYFYGIPDTAYGVRLWTNSLLVAVTEVQDFAFPPGYQEALTLTLAERCGPSFGQKVSADTKKAAKDARALIFGLNDDAPMLVTRDAGLGGGRGTGFNYRDRSSI